MMKFLVRSITSLICVGALSPLALLAAQTSQTPQDSQQQQQQPAQPKKINERPAASVAPAPEPFDSATVEKMAAQCVRLETEAGVIELELMPETAPETVRNFLNLAATGAFDTTTFHRTVKGFVIQGGVLSTRQTITPELARRASRTIPDEPNLIKHERGIVSMARTDKPHTATTSFFILVGTGAHLDGTFAAFGRVTRGMEVADAINSAPAEGDKPVKPVRLTRASVSPCPVPAAQQ
ncbi:MAG TPA: peptidylprolyl isomerase [Pyrinomonadaceae bacterium]|jgi:peptidyl-prolyl cis-trans isomerase B (cyclophilin B)|nr:peptidylprolyl isomerase [Pyrinomonadaceae bacterium]